MQITSFLFIFLMSRWLIRCNQLEFSQYLKPKSNSSIIFIFFIHMWRTKPFSIYFFRFTLQQTLYYFFTLFKYALFFLSFYSSISFKYYIFYSFSIIFLWRWEREEKGKNKQMEVILFFGQNIVFVPKLYMSFVFRPWTLKSSFLQMNFLLS